VKDEKSQNGSVPGANEPGNGSQMRQFAVQRSVLQYLHDLIYLMAIVLLVLMLCFRVVIVSGSSMKTTLVDGDYLLLLGNVFYKEPQHGDVVVISKDSFKDGEPIVKRVIAVQGQTVDIDFTAGIVYVDGVALDEPYINTPTNLYDGTNFPLVVKEGCIFVMGDNRNSSKDSRNPQIGLIDEREVMGKAIFLMLPGVDELTKEREFDRIGVLK